MNFDSSFSMFSIMEVIFPLFFLLVFGIIIFSIIKGIQQWSYNNAQPVLTVPAKVVSKRTDIRRHAHNHENHVSHTTSTLYYVTFEVDSGDRMELKLNGKEFGQIADGDFGDLTFQGTRYHQFKRWIS